MPAAAPSAPAPAPAAPRAALGSAALLAAAALAAYHNTFSVPFLFDDADAIVGNPTIRTLWPPWSAWVPPPGGGTTSGRPLVNFSLALNYALSGTGVWSYHLFNLAIHLGAGLALFGLLRRTLALPALAGRFGQDALLLALAAAAWWTLHPLQTQAVTYLVQRAESLMSLCYLLTLYAFVRAVASPAPSRWYALSFAACLAGMACKEVMVSAPLLVLLFDRTFVAGSFRAAWGQRRRFYLALAGTWLLLLLLVASTGGNRGGTVGLGVGVGWWAYWLTQFRALPYYLGRAFWPDPLIFEYGTFWEPGLAAVAGRAALVLGLLGATAGLLWRRPALGFLGVWFFALLAPTSLLPGTTQMIVEHRPYLALAAVLTPAAVAVRLLAGRRGLLAGLAVAATLGALTVRRNATYRSEESLWLDTLAKRPQNPRALDFYGLALANRGRLDEAARCFEKAISLNPGSGPSHEGLGTVLFRLGQLEEARAHFQVAVILKPGSFVGHSGLGTLAFRAGDAQLAAHHWQEAARLNPSNVQARRDLAAALLQLGRHAEALAAFQAALQLDPADAATHSDLAAAALLLGQLELATRHGREAVRLDPARPGAHNNLAAVFNRAGQFAAAWEHAQQALRLSPDLAHAHFNAGEALAGLGRFAEATAHFEAELRLRPKHIGALAGLGNALLRTGRPAEALQQLEAALRHDPGHAQARTDAGSALVHLGRPAEAGPHYRAALERAPSDPALHNNLGVALLRSGDLDTAIHHLQLALKLDPAHADARSNLAIATAAKNRTPSAK